MNTRRGMAVAWIAVAGLVALGSAAAGATGARGALIAPLARAAKGDLTVQTIAVDARLGRVFTANYSAESLSVLDATGGRFLRTIPLQTQPVAIAVDERASRLFVVNANTGATGGGSVTVLDAAAGRVLRTVAVGRYPHAVVVDARANRAFVLNGSPYLYPRRVGSVSLLDATTGRVLGTLAVDGYPVAAAADGPAGRLFVAASAYHPCSQTWTSRLEMRDAAGGRLLRALALPRAAGTDGMALAMDARTDRLVVTYGSLIDTGYGSTVRVLNAATGALLRATTMRPTGVAGAGMAPGALALDAASGRAYVAGYDETTYAGRLSILDTATGTLLRTATAGLGAFPIAIAAAPRAGRLVVVDGVFDNGRMRGDGSVRVLDATSGRLLRVVAMETGVPEQVAAAGSLAFMIDADGVTSVLDVRSGRIVQTVDGATGRAT